MAWLWSIAGSVVAASAIYLLAVVIGVDYLSFLQWIPGISSALIERIAGRLVTDGLPYSLFLVFGGVPLKLYVGLAFSLGLSLGSVLLWTVFARIVRIAPTFATVAAIRLVFGRAIDARPKVWAAALAGFWLVFNVFYFIRMSGD